MSRSFGATRLTILCPIHISPPVISSSPASMRSSVDLPQPDGPTSTQNSPSTISMSTPRMTGVDPKRLCTARMLTAANASPPRAARAAPDCPLCGVAPGSGDNDVLGTPGLEPRDDILCCLAPQFDLRLHAVKRGMRRQDHLRVAEQPAIGGNGFYRQDIQ